MIFAHLIQTASSLPSDASALKSAISALESEINALESSSVPWEQSLKWFTASVAFGVAMELWIIWRERQDGLEAWARGIIRPPDRPSVWRFVVEVASVLFIVAGIVGELWVGVAITSINGRLRTKGAELRSKSDQLLALVIQQAGDAQTSAEGAASAAIRAQAAVDTVGKRAEDIDSDLARTQYLMSARSINDFDSLVRQLKQYKHQTVHVGSPSEAEQDAHRSRNFRAEPARDDGHRPNTFAHDEFRPRRNPVWAKGS